MNLILCVFLSCGVNITASSCIQWHVYNLPLSQTVGESKKCNSAGKMGKAKISKVVVLATLPKKPDQASTGVVYRSFVTVYVFPPVCILIAFYLQRTNMRSTGTMLD